MSSYVPAAPRRLVEARANGLCEYCLIHQADTFFGCQVEHVLAEKHGGATTAENLAYACVLCNRFKGSDIASLSKWTGQLTRFFDPRTDVRSAHFKLDGQRIVPLSDVGEVTARILDFNAAERVLEREALAQVGRYPTPEALSRMFRR